MADTVVRVVSSGMISGQQVQEALLQLAKVGAKHLRLVFKREDASEVDYKYGRRRRGTTIFRPVNRPAVSGICELRRQIST